MRPSGRGSRRNRVREATACRTLFSAGAAKARRLCIAKQNRARPAVPRPHVPLPQAGNGMRGGASLPRSRPLRSPRRPHWSGHPNEGTHHDIYLPYLSGRRAEPTHHASQTARVLDELQMQGWRPHEDEPDPRPLPDADDLGRALSDVFDVLGGVLADTRLEPDLPDLLWSVVNVFHRKSDRVQRELDDNEDRQRRAQQEQDGSEVKIGRTRTPHRRGA